MPSRQSLPSSSEIMNQIVPPKLSGELFASLLRDSTERFIADYGNAAKDFSSFTSIFSRLIHSVRDPPLEVLWFYSAVIFHETKLAVPRRDRVAAVKDLFQLVVSCSAPGGPVKRIAVLAPVVYELFDLALEKEQRLEEVRSLVEGLVSYISMCCTGFREEEDDQRLSSSFFDVVRVWMVDRFGIGDELVAFLPIVGGDVLTEMKKEEPCRLSHLAGIVMCEALLLRLCLRLGLESSRLEVEKDVRNCAAQMISGGFRCLSFFETLLKTMLEPVLPVLNLLKSKDECFLREVLYDSVIMADYSCFKSQQETLLPSDRLKNIAVMWLLIIVEDAICFTRKYGDESKVVMCTRVFSESCLTSHLIKWITNQNGMQGKIAPNVSTPTALIQWILVVEDQGVRVFDSEIYKIRAKEVTCSSRFVRALPVSESDNGDLDMVDLHEDTLRIEGQRKRKGTMFGSESQVKSVKFQAHDSSAGLSCGSEMGNPVPDKEMADNMQQ